jgi:hypothetical protein
METYNGMDRMIKNYISPISSIFTTAFSGFQLPFAIAANYSGFFSISAPDNTRLAPDLKTELGFGFHILPKAGI